jgi:pimeloyl-ACP methyl ester carboxylesterase
MTEPPTTLVTLAERFDPEIFDVGPRHARLRVQGSGMGVWDVLIHAGTARVAQARPERRPDAVVEADAETWHSLAENFRGGMEAFRTGRLTLRHDLHLGVGFLAATAADPDGNALRFRPVQTSLGEISTMEAGTGDPVVLIHGLGATKASFLPTVAALAPAHRVIALDLPGFGDSVKPLAASYDARFLARGVIAVLNALGLDRAHLVGNSMGGRVAIEAGLNHRHRVDRLVLLAPSLAWLRDRPWAPLLRLVPPQLGAMQPAPRALVEAIARAVVPGGSEGWTAAGVDEFLRSYLNPRGRAAFYAAARNIYLEEPHGPEGFWTRLETLQAPSLFVWGRQDRLVPLAFSRHVRRELPEAEHLVLDCGHVPQLERPHVTHDAIARFLA